MLGARKDIIEGLNGRRFGGAVMSSDNEMELGTATWVCANQTSYSSTRGYT